MGDEMDEEGERLQDELLNLTTRMALDAKSDVAQIEIVLSLLLLDASRQGRDPKQKLALLSNLLTKPVATGSFSRDGESTLIERVCANARLLSEAIHDKPRR